MVSQGALIQGVRHRVAWTLGVANAPLLRALAGAEISTEVESPCRVISTADMVWITPLGSVLYCAKFRYYGRKKAALSQKLDAARRERATLLLFAPHHKEINMDMIHVLMACSYLVLAVCYGCQALQHVC